MKGQSFRQREEEEIGMMAPLTDEERAQSYLPPLVVVVPGLTSNGHTSYVKDIVRQSEANGFEAVVINYRGLAGVELATPKLYNSMAVDDVLEPMRFVYEKYCEKEKRPTFAIGVSMGANILANLIGFEGENCFLSGAFICQAPIMKWKCVEPIRRNAFGFYNYVLGSNLNEVMMRHEPIVREHF